MVVHKALTTYTTLGLHVRNVTELYVPNVQGVAFIRKAFWVSIFQIVPIPLYVYEKWMAITFWGDGDLEPESESST